MSNLRFNIQNFKLKKELETMIKLITSANINKESDDQKLNFSSVKYKIKNYLFQLINSFQI